MLSILYIMLSRPLRLFIENEIENIFIENIMDDDLPPRSPIIRRASKLSDISDSHRVYSDFIKKGKPLTSLKKGDLSDILRSYKSSISFDRENYYTRGEIREIKASYDFSLSGKKTDLVCRVEKMFLKEKLAIFMQKVIRGSYVRKLMRLRGPALKNRSICVNDTDFYSLEPLKEIPLESFYSYKGSGNFVYGFDVSSLLTLLKNTKRLQNPYNRESMEREVNDIYYVARLSKLVHTSEQKDVFNAPAPTRVQTLQYQVATPSLSRLINVGNNIEYDHLSVINKLNEIRSRSMEDRIRSAFMEIDQLGFYTQSSWFSNLQRFNFIRFFSSLYDIWHYRAQLSFETKRKICPLQDPFIRIMREPMQYSALSEEQIRSMSIEVIEDMIYTGIDNDNKSLGAFHVLSALTLVSIPARDNMPWLYESVIF